MKTLKLHFTDFWPTFDPSDNFFTRLLSRSYWLQLDEKNPELVVYSCFGMDFMKYRCVRVFYTGENKVPNFRQCDFSLSFKYEDYDGRNCRLPVYLIENDIGRLLEKKDPAKALEQKTGFCNFIYSNARPQERIRFFRALSKYKQVDSWGMVMNNQGGPVRDKHACLSRYKFTIAYENISSPGYTTEKIVEPMLAGSIPIYWGNPQIGREFNTHSFINVHEFRDYEQVIERIKWLDRDDDAFRACYSQPWLPENRIPQSLQEQYFLQFFGRVVSSIQSGRPVAITRRVRLKDRITYWLYLIKNRIKGNRRLVATKRKLTGTAIHPLLRDDVER